MFLHVDLQKKLSKPKIFLCKPNKVTVAKLNTAYNIELILKLGSISELNFNLPYDTYKHNRMQGNKQIKLIKDKYLIKLVYGQYTEWYTIKKTVDNMEEDSDYKNIQCFGLGYELVDKRIRSYKVTSYNARQMLEDVLANTIWRVNYIDGEFETKFRSLDISSSTVLDVLYQICEIFEAVPIFDTVNRKISLYKLENIGVNKGLRISYGKYLQTMNKTTSTDEIITRLYAYGYDNRSIERVNPSGTKFIQDFSYFMQGFSQDDQGNVISHSPHMSDELCIGLINYNKFLDSKEGEFQTLLSQKENYQEQLTTKNNELDTLEIELEIIEDQLSVANASGQPTGSLITQKNNKQTQINNKKSEIQSIQSNINNIDNQITTLRNSIKIENHLSTELLIEFNPFIIEDEFVNSSYTKDTDLYEAVKKQITLVSQPKINIEMDIVNFLEMITERRNHDKLNLGDTITVIQEKLNTNVEAKLLEIKFSFESGNVGVVISNVKDLLNDKDKFLSNLNKAIGSSTSFDMNKLSYDNSIELTSEVNRIINDTWDATKRKIIAGVNETVDISNKGIIIKSTDNPNDLLVAQAGVIAISNDSGNTYKNAITTQGVIGERVFGKILAGVNLIIDSSDTQGNKTFTVDSTGVKIRGQSLTIEGGLQPEQLDPSFKDSLVEFNRTYSNGVLMDSTNGLVVTRSDDKVKTILNATEGIKIAYKDGATWRDRFYVDSTTGKLMAEELSANKLIIKNGNDVLIDASTRTINLSNFTTIAGKIKADNIDATNLKVDSVNVTGTLNAEQINLRGTDIRNSLNQTTFSVNTNGDLTLRGNLIMTGGSISWANINKPSYTASEVGALPDTTVIPTVPSYITSTKITSTTIESPSITGGTITGGTVRTAASGTRVVMTSNFADTYWYSGNNLLFKIYDAQSECVLGGGLRVVCEGTWDFSRASLAGVTAKFG